MVQVVLGIFTVLYSPDKQALLWLGVAHQFVAMSLIVVHGMWTLRRLYESKKAQRLLLLLYVNIKTLGCKSFLKGLLYSFPIQLVLLHFKKYQVLLLFWYILGSAINGNFMSTFGADSLFLAPEYLGKVNAVSAILLEWPSGIFIMSWHITTFILHSNHFKFLATTSKPFLKFFINNSVIPILFLLFYCTGRFSLTFSGS